MKLNAYQSLTGPEKPQLVELSSSIVSYGRSVQRDGWELFLGRLPDGMKHHLPRFLTLLEDMVDKHEDDEEVPLAECEGAPSLVSASTLRMEGREVNRFWNIFALLDKLGKEALRNRSFLRAVMNVSKEDVPEDRIIALKKTTESIPDVRYRENIPNTPTAATVLLLQALALVEPRLNQQSVYSDLVRVLLRRDTFVFASELLSREKAKGVIFGIGGNGWKSARHDYEEGGMQTTSRVVYETSVADPEGVGDYCFSYCNHHLSAAEFRVRVGKAKAHEINYARVGDIVFRAYEGSEFRPPLFRFTLHSTGEPEESEVLSIKAIPENRYRSNHEIFAETDEMEKKLMQRPTRR